MLLLNTFDKYLLDEFVWWHCQPLKHAFWELSFLWLISHNIFFFWLFTSENLFMVLCKCLFTMFTTKLLFPPSVTYYGLVNFLSIGIGLSTINTHTDRWLFEFGYMSMQCKNPMCFAMAAFLVGMSWHNIHCGPLPSSIQRIYLSKYPGLPPLNAHLMQRNWKVSCTN